MNHKTNILIVDDDRDISEMLKMILEFKEYTVITLNRTENLKSFLIANKFDLIILDMLIGIINGLNICSDLKKDERFSYIPILMFSALPDGRKMALDAGADDFIEKPFSMNEMLEKINTVLNLTTGK